MSREAMKMALEFIEQVDSPYDDRPVITALREALAEQPAQQKPVAWTLLLTGKHHGLVGKAGEKFVGHPEYYERVDVYTSPPAQQKPVAWMDIDENGTFSGLRYWSESDNRHEVALYTSPPAQQEPVFAIRLLTNQCFALAQERDELQKQVWRYEKNGVTCQTYRHKVDASCAECNVHEVYTSPPAQRKPLTLEEIDLLINGRGEPDDDDYVEPIGDGFGLTDADLVRLVRKTEAAHNIKEKS